MSPGERARQVATWRESGESWVAIAARLGVTKQRALQLGRKAGVPPRPYRRPGSVGLASWETDRIREGAERNWSNAAIAETIGRSITTVREHRNAMKLPTHTRMSDRERTQINALLGSGLSDYEIAAAVGTSRQRVRYLRLQAGLPTVVKPATPHIAAIVARNTRRVAEKPDAAVEQYRAEKARKTPAKLAVLNHCKAQLEEQIRGEQRPDRPRRGRGIHVGPRWEEAS